MPRLALPRTQDEHLRYVPSTHRVRSARNLFSQNHSNSIICGLDAVSPAWGVVPSPEHVSVGDASTVAAVSPPLTLFCFGLALCTKSANWSLYFASCFAALVTVGAFAGAFCKVASQSRSSSRSAAKPCRSRDGRSRFALKSTTHLKQIHG